MGRKLTVSEETEVLAGVVRAAHEALKDLKAAIREARALEPGLVEQYEATHHREIKQLSNFFTEESNHAATTLNNTVEEARVSIRDQLMAGEAVFDRHTSTVTIRFGSGAFDDQVPPPYPEVTTKETDQ